MSKEGRDSKGEKVSRRISSVCTMHTIWIDSESLWEASKKHFSEVTHSEKGLRDLFQQQSPSMLLVSSELMLDTALAWEAHQNEEGEAA